MDQTEIKTRLLEAAATLLHGSHPMNNPEAALATAQHWLNWVNQSDKGAETLGLPKRR